MEWILIPIFLIMISLLVILTPKKTRRVIDPTSNDHDKDIEDVNKGLPNIKNRMPR
jgi:hypothetical protein